MGESGVDIIISPNNFERKPPRIEEILKTKIGEDKSPVFEFKMDYFTVVANCLGVPALTMPVSKLGGYDDGFSSSIRMQGFFGEDYHLLGISKFIEKVLREEGMR
jgi:Asp-tRNA(Asn)/Glu-tRNA(Gln) amidotransferase A subunit family amidase